MASIGNADRPLPNDRYHLWPNGSEPPGYDAAMNQTSVPPSRQNAQQPSTVITVRYYTSYRTIRQITVLVQTGPAGPASLYASRTGLAEPELRRTSRLLSSGPGNYHCVQRSQHDFADL